MFSLTLKEVQGNASVLVRGARNDCSGLEYLNAGNTKEECLYVLAILAELLVAQTWCVQVDLIALLCYPLDFVALIFLVMIKVLVGCTLAT